jgi:hypothetical protein
MNSERSVEISPPSSRGETLAVLRLAALILGTAALYFTHMAGPGAGGAARGSDLAPFQRRFADLDAKEQRAFRSLQEGLVEAENARDASGRWPEPAALAAQGVPPFSPDPTAPRYTWTKLHEGLATEYVGLPETVGLPSYLLQVTEPDPQAPPHAPTPVDEEHHRLSDGTLLHVAVWLHPADSSADSSRAAGRAAAFSVQPAAEGWLQLLARDRPAAAATPGL